MFLSHVFIFLSAPDVSFQMCDSVPGLLPVAGGDVCLSLAEQTQTQTGMIYLYANILKAITSVRFKASITFL